jgi:hypothetical protein
MISRVKSNLRAYLIRRYLRRRGFKVYSRKDWGSKYADVYKYRRTYRHVTADPADTVVQHITVTHLTADWRADTRVVEQIGYDRFQSGMSYNFLVNMATGQISEGQPLDAKGTHTINDKGIAGYSYDQNAVARAIAVVGMPDTPLNPKAEAAIIALLRAMVRYGAITNSFDYLPHSAFAYKDCPCDATRSRMGFIRQMVLDTPKRSLRKWLLGGGK